MGIEGLLELVKFVQEGGTLITEGSTTTIFPEYGITQGVRVEEPAQLFVRGSILRGKWADAKSPIAYGYDNSADLPIYFNQAPVLNAGGGGIPAEFAAFFGGGAANAGLGQNVTPNAVPVHISPFEAEDAAAKANERPAAGCRSGVPSDGATVRARVRGNALAPSRRQTFARCWSSSGASPPIARCSLARPRVFPLRDASVSTLSRGGTFYWPGHLGLEREAWLRCCRSATRAGANRGHRGTYLLDRAPQ